MRRMRKIVLFSIASLVALILTIQHTGKNGRVGTPNSIQTARAEAAEYDLSRLPIVSKTLFYVRENYFDKSRLEPRKMLVGALDFIQRDVPEILIDRHPETDPKQVTVKVNGQEKTFNIEGVNAPWTLSRKLQEIFAFIQPNLQKGDPEEREKRLASIEMAATNGMLETLDPHSTLLDVDSYREMRTQTSGKFGGLGIVIEMDSKNRLTVKKPMKGMPAWQAGIRAKDRIVRIDNESTINMTLSEAVERLRGRVNEPVDIYVEREGVQGRKKYTILRGEIKPPSIDPDEVKILKASLAPGQPPVKVGYFRMQHFTANSEENLHETLKEFRREGVKGVIMDLRSNPGGLLDQAQKVADAFLESGTIVSTVGVGGSQREDKYASKTQVGPPVPVAVLVNQYSASASEIVAGALKNHDRAVIMGETTFGKGSVQVLYDLAAPVSFGQKVEDNKLGLKLTIAQYLTPGDISIQGVGVTPDVETIPMVVDQQGERTWIRLQRSNHKRREADYDQHLEHPRVKKGEKPVETVSYVYLPKPGDKRPLSLDDEEEELQEPQVPAADDPEGFKPDFLIEVARDLLAQSKGTRRRDVLAQSKGFFDKVRDAEDRKLAEALKKFDIDWTRGPANTSEPQLEMSLKPVGSGTVQAGEVVKLRGVVRNVGEIPAYRVRAVLESDNPLFDENELLFGYVEPGQTRTYDLTVKVPKSSLTRTDYLKSTLVADGGVQVGATEALLEIQGRPRPLFAYAYQSVDDLKGNRDGQVQKGEELRMVVTVKNIGEGTAPSAEAILRNGPGQQGVLINAGRFELGELQPGQTKTASFIYEVGSEFDGEEMRLDLMVGDTTLGEPVQEKIHLKVAPPGPSPDPAAGTVTVARKEAVLKEAPLPDALVVGTAPKGAVFRVKGTYKGYTQVELAKDRFAFVASAEVQQGGLAKKVQFEPEWQVTPPVIALTAPKVTFTNQETVRLEGLVTDDKHVRDVFIKVWNRNAKRPVKKVYYKPNNKGGDPTKLDFIADVPLWPGNNIIQIFARESDDVESRRTLVVLRREGSSMIAAPASKADEPGKPPAGRK